MNYEKIILELMGRIQMLEEQMAALLSAKDQTNENTKVSTEDMRNYIQNLKNEAKASGLDKIILKSGDLHKDLNLKNAMPQICNAMSQSMNDDDVVLHTTPSGNSSTIEIEYKI